MARRSHRQSLRCWRVYRMASLSGGALPLDAASANDSRRGAARSQRPSTMSSSRPYGPAATTAEAPDRLAHRLARRCVDPALSRLPDLRVVDLRKEAPSSEPKWASHLRKWWRGRDLNPRPLGYEGGYRGVGQSRVVRPSAHRCSSTAGSDVVSSGQIAVGASSFV